MLAIINSLNKETLAIENYQKLEKKQSPFKEMLSKDDYSNYSLLFNNEEISFKDIFLLQINIKKSISLLAFFKKNDFNKDDVVPSLLELKNIKVKNIEAAKNKLEASFSILENHHPLFYICILQNKYSLSIEDIQSNYTSDSHLFFIDEIENKKNKLPTEVIVEEKQNDDIDVSEESIEVIEEDNEIIDEEPLSEPEEIQKESEIEDDINPTEEEKDGSEDIQLVEQNDNIIQEVIEVIKEPEPTIEEKVKVKEKPVKTKKKHAKKRIFDEILVFFKRYKFHLLFLLVSAFLVGFGVEIISYSIALEKAPHPLLYICLSVGVFLNGFVYYDYFNAKKINNPLFYVGLGAGLLGLIFSIPIYYLYQSIDKTEETVSAPASALWIGLLISLVAVAISIGVAYLIIFIKKKKKAN